MTGRGPVYFKRPAWPGWGLGKGKKAGHLECVLRLYSTCAALYSACTPLVLRCTPLVLHLCCAVLHLYSTCAALYSTCTPLYSASLVEAYELGSPEKFRKSMKLGSNIQGREDFGFFQWETVRSRRRNPKIFRLGILFPIPIDFCEFSAGHGDFSWSFRPVPIVLGDRNPRPGLYSAILHSYSACTPLYSAYTPLYSTVLHSYSASTLLVLRSTGVSLFPPWVNHKNIKFMETFLSSELCRALFAGHFSKKFFKTWSINNNVRV
jgi:hypothetical protein